MPHRPPITPPPSRLARLVAELRFAFMPRRIVPGDRVVVLVDLRYRARLDRWHLPCVPAGARGMVRAVGAMPGFAGGAVIDLLDAAGRPSRYWTGAGFDEIAALPPGG